MKDDDQKQIDEFLNEASGSDKAETEQSANEDKDLDAKIVAALKTVYDPEIPVDIYELGLIYDIAINEENNNVHIQMTLTAPGCPVAETFPGTVKDAVESHVDEVNEVTVEIVWEPPWTMDRMSQVARLQLGMFD